MIYSCFSFLRCLNNNPRSIHKHRIYQKVSLKIFLSCIVCSCTFVQNSKLRMWWSYKLDWKHQMMFTSRKDVTTRTILSGHGLSGSTPQPQRSLNKQLITRSGNLIYLLYSFLRYFNNFYFLGEMLVLSQNLFSTRLTYLLKHYKNTFQPSIIFF